MLPVNARVRSAAALAVLALVGGAVAMQPSVSASATPAPAAVRAVANQPLIQGVAVNQQGKPVDDVKVQAIDADGKVAATSLTYASTRPGGAQHGYFYLEVPRGTYTVKLSKDGYQAVTYAAGTITKRKRTISLGEIEIKKIVKPSSTSASLAKKSITTKERASVTVTVTSAATKKPTGTVEVRVGREVVGTGTLVGKDKGTITIAVKKLSKGNYTLKAHYLGSEDLRASSSKAVTLQVTKPKKG